MSAVRLTRGVGVPESRRVVHRVAAVDERLVTTACGQRLLLCHVEEAADGAPCMSCIARATSPRPDAVLDRAMRGLEGR